MARESEDDQRKPEKSKWRGDREDWFEEGGCSKLRQVERQSVSNCRRNGVIPNISAKGTTLKKSEHSTTTNLTQKES